MANLAKRYAKKIKDKAVDVASDVLSLPKRAYYGAKRKHQDVRADLLKKRSDETRALREMDEAGVADAGHSDDPLFRYRAQKKLSNKK